MSESKLPTKLDIDFSSKLIEEVYKDCSPAVKAVGEHIKEAIDLAFSPIKLFHLTLEHNLGRYTEWLKTQPQEKLKRPEPEIAVPVLQKLSHVQDTSISNLFLNLLCKASSIEFDGRVHPYFMHVINSITPDEASMIKRIHEIGQRILPYIVMMESAEGGGSDLSHKIVYKIEIDYILKFGGNYGLYLNNLEQLGLVSDRMNNTTSDDSIYTNLYNKFKPEFEARISAGQSLGYRRGIIELTPLFSSFVEVCLND
jgi:hypothetical protein